jgi:hypothetical protein
VHYLVLNEITGSYMGFAGAAWSVRPVIEVLSPLLPFNFTESHTSLQRMAARHMSALQKAILSLEGHYRSSPSVDTHHSSRRYAIVKYFPIKPALLPLQTRRHSTLSMSHNPRTVDHLLCLDWRRSQLLNFEKLAGGWCMVVMDLIFDYIEFHQFSTVLDIFDELHDILSQLHKAGFVHGDIRDTYIMIPRCGERGFLLVDFDWTGKTGNIRPMYTAERSKVWRSNGTFNGEC